MRSLPFTLLLIGLLGVSTQARPEGRLWLDSVDAALAEAQEKDRLILVDLYADWCGWCKKLEEEVFSTPSFQEFAEEFVLLRVDTEDGAEGTLLQQKYQAYSLPTILILDPKQVRVGEVLGFAPTERFVASLRREIEAFDELIKGFERFGQTSELRALAILADEFHQRNDGERAASLYQQMLRTDDLPREKAVLVQYQLTDALRLAGRYDEALEQLGDTRPNALDVGNAELVERLDLLGAQVAIDRGDCQQAESELQHFLSTYRKSQLRKQANRTLATLRADGYRCL